MDIAKDPVEDGVPEGGIADNVMPVLDGELANEDGSAAGVAVVEDFEQVVAAPGSHREARLPVVEVEEPGAAVVAVRKAKPAGLVAERGMPSRTFRIRSNRRRGAHKSRIVVRHP